MYESGRDQKRKQRSGGHLHVLRSEEDLASLGAVGHDTADQRKQEDGDAAEKLIERQQEG